MNSQKPTEKRSASWAMPPSEPQLILLESWPHSRPVTLVLLVILILLFLSLYGCSDVSTRDAPPTPKCHVPLADLAPREPPPMTDATNQELLQENKEVRNVLAQSEADKARVKNFILERCKDSFSLPASGS